MSKIDVTVLSTDKLLEQIPNTTELWFLENMKLFEGDHWMDGEGWAGPQLKAGDEGAAAMMATIKKAFVSKNAVSEIVLRHVAGILGNDPIWKVTSDQLEEETEGTEPGDEPAEEPEQSPLAKEAEDVLREWWDGEQGLVAGKRLCLHH